MATETVSFITKTLTTLITKPPAQAPSTPTAVWAAVITGSAALLAAVVAATVALRQQRQNRLLQREKIELEDHFAKQRILWDEERDALIKRTREDQEFEDRIQAQAEHANEVQMYSIEYRRKIVNRLRRLKILDMSRSLDLDRLYVQLRVREEQSPRFLTEKEVAEATTGEPEYLLRISRERLRLEARLAVSPEEALTRFQRAIVVGDPGAGKTTMLRYLAFKIAHEELGSELVMPVYVELREFIEGDYTDLLSHAANDMLNRYGFPDARPYIDQQVANGHAVLLLDGLDEVLGGASEEAADAAYRKVAAEIDRLATRYPSALIVVTCRRAGWRGGLPQFQTLEVLDFDWPEIQAFVENWFADDPAKGNNLRDALSRNLRMQTLAANPLLLSLISIVYERDLELPERRAELYNRCVEVLLKDWDAHRDIRRFSHFTADRKRDLLEEIAWHFHRMGQRYFPSSELLSVIADFLPTIDLGPEQAEAILNEIVAQYGLLKVQAHGWYGFLHLTLQEYFAAVATNERGQGAIANIARMHHSPWWEEVILLLAGRMVDASPLLLAILGRSPEVPEPGSGTPLSMDDDIFQGDLLLAARCLGGTPRLRVSWLRERLLGEARNLMLQTPYRTVCEHAAHVLVEIGGRTTSTDLASIIADSSIKLERRTALVQAFDNFGDASIAPSLFDALKHKKDITDELSDAIINALSNFKYKTALPFLIHSAQEYAKKGGVRDESYKMSEVVRGIGALGDESVKPTLWSWLRQSTRRGKREVLQAFSLIHAIGQLGDTDDVDRLLALFDRTEEDHDTIAVAVIELAGEAVAPRLMSIIASSRIDDWGAFEVANALKRSKVTISAEDVFALFMDISLDWRRRWSVADLFLNCPRQECEARLCALLKERTLEDSLKIKVATILATWGNGVGVPLLLNAFNEERLPTQVKFQRGTSEYTMDTWASVSTALNRLGEKTIVPVLLAHLDQALAEKRMPLVDNLASALVPFKPAGVAPKLLESIDNWYVVGALMTEKDIPLVYNIIESKISAYVYGSNEVFKAISEIASAPEDAAWLLSLLEEPLNVKKPSRSIDKDYVSRALETVTKRAGVRAFTDGRIVRIADQL